MFSVLSAFHVKRLFPAFSAGARTILTRPCNCPMGLAKHPKGVVSKKLSVFSDVPRETSSVTPLLDDGQD